MHTPLTTQHTNSLSTLYFYMKCVRSHLKNLMHCDVLEADDVWVLQFAKVFDISFLLLSDLLNRDLFRVKLSEEHCALSSAPQPLQFRDLLEGHLPHLCWPIREDIYQSIKTVWICNNTSHEQTISTNLAAVVCTRSSTSFR